MVGLDWPAMMRVGMGELKLRPAAFWALSPAELMVLVNPPEVQRPMGRSGFEALISAFPDEKD